MDFAQKRRVRAGDGWALRTVKLQMSRKLMYAAGLLSCYSCKLELAGQPPEHGRYRVVEHLEGLVRKTPLDILARAALSFGEFSACAKDLFSAYDEFLAVLDDPDRRTYLEKLAPGQEADPHYQQAHAIGKRFEGALIEMFFDSQPLAELTRRYGVF
ncbi:MAG TPA: hypothetical protein VFJ82_09150 [Longimicrobium sp.]|nr:hypothetical protein [Longimicrobium sp.]